MTSYLVVSVKSALRARVRRYASLRAAQRALAPAAPLPESSAAAARAHEMLRELEAASQRLAAQAKPDGAELASVSKGLTAEHGAELERIDRLLDEYGAQLRSVVDRIPLAQFRATLPQSIRSERVGVAALLDLCLEDAETRSQRLSLIDYLVTLLASEEEEGYRKVVVDPVGVSPRTRELCASFAERSDAEAVQAEEAFRQAIEDLYQGEDLQPVIERMRSWKERVVSRYFVPGVLRSLVSYNLAAYNRLRELAESERMQDLVFYGRIGFSETLDLDPTGAAAPADSGPRTSPPARMGDTDSVFASPGLRALEGALRARLRDEESDPGPAAEIAARADLAMLSGSEVSAFTDGEEDGLGALTRTCVVVGLALRQLPEASEALAELGVEAAVLRQEWAQEIHRRVQRATEEFVAGGAYESARQLSQTKAKFLYESLAAAVRERQRGEPAAPSSPSQEESEEAPRTSDFASARGRRGRASKAPARRRRRRWLRVPGRRVAVAAGSILGLALAAYLFALNFGPGTVRLYTADELTSFSSYLDAGYRNGRGTGPLFVGTLSSGWRALPEERRLALAQHMAERLDGAGVREVLVFDAQQRLQVHAQRGRLRFPRAE